MRKKVCFVDAVMYGKFSKQLMRIFMNKTTCCIKEFEISRNLLRRFCVPILAGATLLTSCLSSRGDTFKVWGCNQNGQLGLGCYLNQFSPQLTSGLSGVKQIALGSRHALALMNDGTVKACGNNQLGQLGLGNFDSKNKFVTVPGLSNIKQVAVGYSHSIAVTNDGKVKVWGSNSYGELGLGDTLKRKSPTEIPGLTNVKQVAAGWNYTLALKTDGTVVAWGNNSFGQVGWGVSISPSVPVAVSGLTQVKQVDANHSRSVALLNNGTIKMWGGCGKDTWFGFPQSDIYGAVRTPTLVPGLFGVKQVAAGFNHTIVLLENGKVKAWGENNVGQLGLGSLEKSMVPLEVPGLSEVKQIAAGDFHTLALLQNGTVMAFGYNESGELGIGSLPLIYFKKITSPTKIPALAGIQQIMTGTLGGVAKSY